MNKELGFGLELNSTDSGGLVLSRRWLGRNEHIITANPREMRMVAEALMAALGEPVDAKPESDRSELDVVSEWRWLWTDADGDKLNRCRYRENLDQTIELAKENHHGEVFIYEFVAHVGPKPEPVERKVVRL